MKRLYIAHGKYALVDDEDFERVSKLKWCLQSTGHVRKTFCITVAPQKRKYKTILLHRFILNLKDPEIIVDHIDRNPLNNKKSNLRLCTRKQNQMNGGPQLNKKYKGTYYFKKNKKWSARIQINNNNLWLGFYKTEEEAALAYNNAAIKYYGEFAYLNKIP